MRACGGQAGPQNYWIQGIASVAPGSTDYQLTAPLDAGSVMVPIADRLTAAPPLAKRLILTGAPFFVINATATLYSNSSNYIALGLSTSDEIIDTIYAGDTLPLDTIVFNRADSAPGTSATTIIQSCVPPGTYFVSCAVRVGGVGAEGTNAAASLAINANPVTAPDAQASAASLPQSAWNTF